MLVANGHSFVEVSNYSLPQLWAFVELVDKRTKRETRVNFISRGLSFGGKKEDIQSFLKSLETQ